MSVYSFGARIPTALERQVKIFLMPWLARKNLLSGVDAKIALLSRTVTICADNISTHLFCLCRAALKHQK